MIPESGDDSGLFLHYTDQVQPQTAGVLLMGTGGLAPKHSTTFFETACKINDARHIHPFAFRTHTHSLGILLKKNFIAGQKIDKSPDKKTREIK